MRSRVGGEFLRWFAVELGLTLVRFAEVYGAYRGDRLNDVELAGPTLGLRFRL